MLSHLRHELLHVVHARPLVLPPSAAIVTQFVTRLQARGQTDHLLVRYAQAVGNRRWPGSVTLPPSVRVAGSPTALWSAMVVRSDLHLIACMPCPARFSGTGAGLAMYLRVVHARAAADRARLCRFRVPGKGLVSGVADVDGAGPEAPLRVRPPDRCRSLAVVESA
jgi:hypothetical protein